MLHLEAFGGFLQKDLLGNFSSEPYPGQKYNFMIIELESLFYELSVFLSILRNQEKS